MKCFGFIRDLLDLCQAVCLSDFLTSVRVFCKIKKLKVIHVSHYDYMPPDRKLFIMRYFTLAQMCS